MKQIGDRIKWNTVNGQSQGEIVKMTIVYTVREDNGRIVPVCSSSVIDD